MNTDVVSERDLKSPEIYAARDWGMGFFSCVGRPRRERSEACVYYRSGFAKAVHLRAPLPPGPQTGFCKAANVSEATFVFATLVMYNVHLK